MIRREPRLDVLGQLTALRRYAQSLTRHDVGAEELAHDAPVRADEERATFHTGGNLKVWLLSILYNVYVNRSRARYAEARDVAHAGELTEPHLPPRQDHHVRLCQVRQAFLALPKEQCAAPHLVAIEGLTCGEAAARRPGRDFDVTHRARSGRAESHRRQRFHRVYDRCQAIPCESRWRGGWTVTLI